MLVEQIKAVLDEYREYLPLTARQVYYRLVGAYNYPKKKVAYDRLLETLGRARRARLIPMEHIRDDRAEARGVPSGYEDPAEFFASVRAAASDYARPLDQSQPTVVEVWCEAAGALPMLARVTKPFGVAVYSSGGFESLGAKYLAAERIAGRGRPTLVLSIGDLDPSGLSMVDAAAEDVAAFVDDLGAQPPTISRLAVTSEQVTTFDLPTAPQKDTDHRGEHMSETVQAEALSPEQLVRIVREAVAAAVDLPTLQEVRRRSAEERQAVVDAVAHLPRR
ncbi:hypothetical protein [Streptomyces noursei]|uniref:Uncharacterized protein n=1 Tax=Streptomyces noursei TaxID=1971 RepID=A0A401QRR3_STRNR|nr:hypothetical protein [Streptomyces noursei]EXU86566.1 hypothetical protein P354_41440 [Streptomyces noursei PD-1]GCB88008.1 hypothetical protein SALB_00677 [Streptomyces noursei]